MKYRLVVLMAFVVLAVAGFMCQRSTTEAAKSIAETEPQQRPQTKRPAKAKVVARPLRVDYSSFSHRTKQHQQACDNCHKFPSPNWKEARKGDAAFEDVTEYPQHASCLSCHMQQFFTGAQPVICSVCHTNASPRNGTRYPFPSLGEAFYASKRGANFSSDFKLNFPHDKHIEIVGQLPPDTEQRTGVSFTQASFVQEDAAKQNTSCNVCHQTAQPQGASDEEYVTKPPKGWPEDAFWLKKGTFKTLPLTHETCFSCHSRETGQVPLPSDCNACHKLAPSEQMRSDFDAKLAAQMGVTDKLTLLRWQRREAGAFRHEVSHSDLACASCHAVTTMNTLDEKTKKVPILSCGGAGTGCHITATDDEGGILNYFIEQRKTDPSVQCTKCHIVFGKEPIPQSHLNALALIKSKANGK